MQKKYLLAICIVALGLLAIFVWQFQRRSNYVTKPSSLCLLLLAEDESVSATIESLLSQDVKTRISSNGILIDISPAENKNTYFVNINIYGEQLPPISTTAKENPQFVTAGKGWSVWLITYDKINKLLGV